ncbi:CaiB/BaiF CoA transferase family protein [Pseudarthrobacter sp. J1738]|uniref:CaiB/BaiF CoA transferase family protein n=1 Tax=Pseudarthrobacter sp. J1738 TaxID=3420446 RepID=UPI003D2A2007
MSGPLQGVKVVELAALGPAPHAAMMLADMGADVVRIVGPAPFIGGYDVDTHLQRGRTTVRADLKDHAALAKVRSLINEADVLLEGFRPGTTERLGLGPAEFLEGNPRLIYARMTGWGQSGPLAARAGHDINYLALSGALNAVGPAEHPVPPLNLVGDFGAGSMLVLTGILAALVEREYSGMGQVVDAAMLDGIGMLSQLILELRSVGMWTDTRGSNLLDGAAPYYRCYRCADGQFVAVGAIEDPFYAELLSGLGLREQAAGSREPISSAEPTGSVPERINPANWPLITELFAQAFAQRSRDEWDKLFRDTDACVTPVLSFGEAALTPQVVARETLHGDGANIVAAAAPRFSRTPSAVQVPETRATESPVSEISATETGVTLEDVLKQWQRK